MGIREHLAAAYAACARSQGEYVTYRQDGFECRLLATPGRSANFAADSQSGAMLVSDVQDFLITAADLVLGGQVEKPQDGDTITRTVGGEPIVYRVGTDSGENCWRWRDSQLIGMRIHTRQIGT